VSREVLNTWVREVFQGWGMTVEIPQVLAKEIERRGLDVIDILISALGRVIDPKLVIKARIELAERYLKEARDFIRKGDAVQASEKVYKVVEECVKALAQHHNLPEYQVASREGRWWTQLLGKASRRLSRILNEPRITDVWARAYEIHVWGSHEAKYGIEDIEKEVRNAEWLLNITKQILREVVK